MEQDPDKDFPETKLKIKIRPPQEVDVLAVLDFQIPCSRPETPGFYDRTSIPDVCFPTTKVMDES